MPTSSYPSRRGPSLAPAGGGERPPARQLDWKTAETPFEFDSLYAERNAHPVPHVLTPSATSPFARALRRITHLREASATHPPAARPQARQLRLASFEGLA